MAVISHARGHRHQVILNILDAKTWEVVEISALGYLKVIVDKDLSLMNWWEGA